MGKRVNYFEAEQRAPTAYNCALVEINAAYIPMVLSRIEGAKAPSFWTTPEDAERGARELSRLQWDMLMSCAAEIVNNIIALRGIDPLDARDPATGTPMNSPIGSTLQDIYNTFQAPGSTPGLMLEQIVINTELTANNVSEGLLSEDGVLLQLLLTAI